MPGEQNQKRGHVVLKLDVAYVPQTSVTFLPMLPRFVFFNMAEYRLGISMCLLHDLLC